MSLSILNWHQPFSGLQGYVDVKFKDKVITVLVDHDFIETDSYYLLKLFGHDAISMFFPQRKVGNTFGLSESFRDISTRDRNMVFFKSVVFPGGIQKHPLVEIGIKEVNV